MSSRSATAEDKRVPLREEIRYALVALIAFERGGLYAYELDRRLRLFSEGFWTPYSGQISRTLHQLEEDGDISSRWNVDDGRPKRIFTAAPSGVQRVDAWLRAEISAQRRPMRDRLWHRFVAHTARQRDHAEMARDIHTRRAVSLEQVRRLEERLAATEGTDAYSSLIRLALHIQQLEWHAELGTLDEIERELAREVKTDLTDRAAAELAGPDEPAEGPASTAGGRGTALA